jgi:FkbM family methyltransferase
MAGYPRLAGAARRQKMFESNPLPQPTVGLAKPREVPVVRDLRSCEPLALGGAKSTSADFPYPAPRSPYGGGVTTRRLLGALRRWVGFDVTPLDDSAFVVQRRGVRPLAVQSVGPPNLRSFVVFDRRAARRHMNSYQRSMAEHLGEQHLLWVFRALGISCVLDVGANRGQFATRLREAGYRGRIVSYEPVARLYAALAEAAADDPDWLVRPWALGDCEGTADINVVPGTMSSLLPASDFGKEWSSKLGRSHTETITIHRLDAVLDEATEGLDEPRIFLKMDTQGYDLATMRGAGHRLDDFLALQSEVSCLPIYEGMPRMTEQLDTYEAAGFAISAMFPVSHHRKTLRAIEFDVVMVRPNAGLPAG